MINLRSQLIQRLRHLPPPLTRDLVAERDLPVPMRDGHLLLADRWAPRSGADGLPTALIRTPYGRAGLMDDLLARPLAERGFQVFSASGFVAAAAIYHVQHKKFRPQRGRSESLRYRAGWT